MFQQNFAQKSMNYFKLQQSIVIKNTYSCATIASFLTVILSKYYIRDILI